LGWNLKEIHVTWPRLGKNKTRLQLYTKVDEEITHRLETSSEILVTPSDHQSDGVRIFETVSGYLRRRHDLTDIVKP
ncbi:hypothetical protein Tco_0429946, partial [Tanacetum coccineum]